MAKDSSWRVVCTDYATKYRYTKAEAKEIAEDFNNGGAACPHQHTAERATRVKQKHE